jgi:hypothetical protein
MTTKTQAASGWPRGFALACALIIGGGAGWLCYQVRSELFPGPGDFNWALWTARDLLAGRDPYDFVPNPDKIPYPLPVALIGLPFVWLPDILAASIYFGLVSTALAWLIARKDNPLRLVLFSSPMFLYTLFFAQWSPIVTISWYIPFLAPLLVTIKPQIALPQFAAHPSIKGVAFAVIVVVISLLIYPSWPLRWYRLTYQFQSIIPVLTLPFGPILLLSALFWRDPRARLLLVMSFLPFRGIYDLLPLFLIPNSRLQIIIFFAISWIVPLISTQLAAMVKPEWSIPILFIPALGMILIPELRKWRAARNTEIHKEITP